MADLAFDIYPADDPRNGSLLVRLTKADFLDGTSYRSALRGMGAGKIVIHSEHAAVQAGHLSADNYVRVIDLGYDEIVGGFFLMEGEETVLSRDEQGGEIRSYGGPGTLSYLARATFPNVLRSDADEELGQHQAYVDATGYLRFTGPETYGGVLGRLIYEARLDEPSAVPDLPAHSWDDVEDSGGTNWTTFTGDYDVRIGDKLLDLAIDLMKKGIDLMLDPHTFTPRAYLQGTFGTDRTSATFASGKVRFQAGVNIMADLDKAIHRLPYVSHLLVVGSDNITEGEYVDPDWSPGDTVYRDTLRLDNTIDALIMEEAAAEHVRERKLRADQAIFPIRSGADDVNGLYAAGIHFVAGDYVTLHTGTGEHDYNEQAIQLAAIEWNMHDNGQFIPSVELGSQYVDARGAAEIRQLSTLIGTHTHPPNPQLCIPGTEGPPIVEASDGAIHSGSLTDALALTVGAEANTAIYVAIGGNHPTASPTAWWHPQGVLTETGKQQLTLIASVTNPVAGGRSDLYRLLAPTAGAGDVVIKDTSTFGMVWGFWFLSNVDQTAPESDIQTAEGTGASSSVSVTAGSNDLVLDVAAWNNANTNPTTDPTPGGSQTEVFSGRWDDSPGNGDGQGGLSYGASTATWTWDAGGRLWTAIGVAVAGAGGTAGDGPPWKIGTSVRASRCDHQHYIDEINGLQAALDALEDAGVSDHGELDGLADDDHPQYQTEPEVDAQIAAAVAALSAAALSTHFEPMIDSAGHVMIDSAGFAHMHEVAH